MARLPHADFTVTGRTPFVVYRIAEGQWFDPWGKAHTAHRVVARRTLTATDEVETIDDGYGTYDQNVYVDGAGNKYTKCSDRVSYSPQTFFKRARHHNDGATEAQLKPAWWPASKVPSRLVNLAGLAVDSNGRVI